MAFFFVFLLTRIVGRRELASLEPFDLILLVMIGDLVQQGVTQNDFSVTGMLLVGGTIGLLTVLLSYTSFKVPFLRPVLDGEPVIIVENGELIARNLDRNRIALGELLVAARGEGLASLDEVQWAVLETNGTISFIKEPRNREACLGPASFDLPYEPEGGAAPTSAFADSTLSRPIACTTSGLSRSRARCCGDCSRLTTYLSSRIAASGRPRPCSRITYCATRSSPADRWKRNEKTSLSAITAVYASRALPSAKAKHSR